jgi:hypothetical protein
MSNKKTVTQMTDPEYTVEFDGKETYVMRNSVKVALCGAGRHGSMIPKPGRVRSRNDMGA